MPPVHNDDPITGKSMSGPILIATVLLLLSTFWGIYDELYTMRPWKSYQSRFITLYTNYLQKEIPAQQEAEKELHSSARFQELKQAADEAEAPVGAQVKQIDDEVRVLNQRIKATQEVFAVARAQATADIYLAEVAGSDSRRESILAGVAEFKQETHAIELPTADGGTETLQQNYTKMEAELARLKNRKAELLTERVVLLADTKAKRDELNTYVSEKLDGLSSTALQGLLTKVRNFKIAIKQIHIKEGDIVERCQSCHLGIPEPVTLAAADMGGNNVFASHPNPDLLAIHDPEEFGCSPCHGGNGRATTSKVKGHGRHKYWLWPMYYQENYEAGCQQCHRNDNVIDYADTLNRGKEIYRLNGCIGCHRYEGFDNQDEQFTNIQNQLLQLTNQRREMELDIGRSERAGDTAETNQEASLLYARAEGLRIKISGLDAETNVLRSRSAELLKEIKKTGPNLKDIKAKLNPDWLPVWIGDPHEWRPTTKMPAFQLEEDEVKAIAAFLWQSASDVTLPRQPRGNAARGKQSFETRGCLACHSIGEGDTELGGYFAANLTRVGEKVNYDFLVRWIHNPRERLRPYCLHEKRDLTPEDYAKHGLSFEWDIRGDTCPNDGTPLMVMNQTIMPSLRLSQQEARDIASYLMTQTTQNRSDYAQVDYLEDAELAAQGEGYVRSYGCAGCHEIAGFETEPRIGTELTYEGSKPIERLDFALKGHEAERAGWYNHKGFFEHKVENPAFFDEGKIKAPGEQLKMPKPNIDEAGVDAITTFLLGSVTPTIPESLQYLPNGDAKEVQEGWWIVTKYNCMGCHQVRIGKKSILEGLPMYQGNKEALPPSLIGAGARLNPDWMQHFLIDPAMSETNTDRNGIRSYLQVRMPTFYLSDVEIGKLVRFFQAQSSQPMPYIPRPQKPLSSSERQIARQLFTHRAAPCLRCHAVGDPRRDVNATAPNFLETASRLKPAWTKRWLIDPASIMPGTAMPSGLFRREGERWVFDAQLPPSVQRYKGDHADLLVRYMFELTAAEQRMLTSRLASAAPASTITVAALLKSH